ncbi:MAG TPA: SOS response-associated peptidase [Acidimicrobiales bacterium]|jgi:putative SOS response-associated peptidase YedK|nr:SOS response-associated peptidase [Acidimicrobiales bacterium]
MCGRIALYTDPDRLSRIFDAQLALGIDTDGHPIYNVPPTEQVLGIVAAGSGPEPDAQTGRVIEPFRWGLIPPRAKDAKVGSRMFNARGETLASRGAFRSAFLSRRVAVLADGFYEWGPGVGKQRQPYFFRRADGQPLTMAGLWERWRPSVEGGDGDDGGDRLTVLTCAIITTAAGPDMDGIHDRMPVILEAGALDPWLDPTNHDRDELEAMVRASPLQTLLHYPVGLRVGNVRNDGPELVEPLAG